jgi:hypothetical protein
MSGGEKENLLISNGNSKMKTVNNIIKVNTIGHTSGKTNKSLNLSNHYNED